MICSEIHHVIDMAGYLAVFIICLLPLLPDITTQHSRHPPLSQSIIQTTSYMFGRLSKTVQLEDPCDL